MDVANNISSPPSAVQSFTTKPSQAAIVAAQLGVPLWPGKQPPGTNGQAIMGSFWTVEPLVSFDGVTFLNPPIEEVRIFDLLDRGFDPQGAIDWMNGNGYPPLPPGIRPRRSSASVRVHGLRQRALGHRAEGGSVAMRSFVILTAAMLAFGGVAHAQSSQGAGYVEAVAQAAFSNVTSQSYGAEAGFTVHENLQIFVEAGADP